MPLPQGRTQTTDAENHAYIPDSIILPPACDSTTLMACWCQYACLYSFVHVLRILSQYDNNAYHIRRLLTIHKWYVGLSLCHLSKPCRHIATWFVKIAFVRKNYFCQQKLLLSAFFKLSLVLKWLIKAIPNKNIQVSI